MTETTSWAEIEFAQAELGDQRRTKRLVRLAAQRAAQPNASLAQSCEGRASTKAAYRFYENPQIKPPALLASHLEATLARLAAEPVVLAVQDTTQLDYSGHTATTGLGVLGDANHHGLLAHSTLAVTPRRRPLGLLHQRVWTRPAQELGKRHDRKTRLLQDKESQKWVDSLEATAHLQAQLPHTLVVNVAQRVRQIEAFPADAARTFADEAVFVHRRVERDCHALHHVGNDLRAAQGFARGAHRREPNCRCAALARQVSAKRQFGAALRVRQNDRHVASCDVNSQ